MNVVMNLWIPKKAMNFVTVERPLASPEGLYFMKVLSFSSIKYLSLSFATFLFPQVHPCGRYRHNTVVFILAKEYNLKNLRTIHRLDRLTSGLLLFGRTPKKARSMEHQIRNRQVQKEYVCRVEGEFPRYHTVILWCYNQQYYLTFQVQISSRRLQYSFRFLFLFLTPYRQVP